MTASRPRVLGIGAALVLALAIGSLGVLTTGPGDGATLVLADGPTLDVTRAPDGAVLIRDATRGGADSEVTILRDVASGALVVREPRSALRSPLAGVDADGALRVPAAADAPLRVELGAGDDTLIADCSGGTFDRGVDYAGGDGFDVLQVIGADGDMTHLARTRHDGAVEVGAMRVDYRELEPITVIGGGAGSSLTLDFTSTLSTVVTLSDDATPGDGVSMVVADSGAEDVVFSNFGTLTIRGGPADNQIVLDDLDTAATIATMNVQGGDGDDTFVVDLSGGLGAWAAAGNAFAVLGQGNGAVGDRLVVSGGTYAVAAHTAANASDGSLDYDGRTITYTGLEPITDLTTAATRSITFSAASETIVLDTGGTAGDGLNLIDSTAAESYTFTSPTAALTVDCGAGVDDLTVSALEGGPPVPFTVSIDGGADADTLTYSGPCAATITPATATSGTVVEPGVMTVGYTDFETVETDPPATLTCSLVRHLLWPARGGFLPAGFGFTTGGTCESGLPVTVTVYSNEGAGSIAPDATVSGGVLRLRAERDVPGSGRVYLVVARVNQQGLDCCTAIVPTLPVGSLIGSLRAAATSAETFCLANNGAAPAGFTQILQYTVGLP